MRVLPWVAMLGVEEELSAEDIVVVKKGLLVSELSSSSCQRRLDTGYFLTFYGPKHCNKIVFLCIIGRQFFG